MGCGVKKYCIHAGWGWRAPARASTPTGQQRGIIANGAWRETAWIKDASHGKRDRRSKQKVSRRRVPLVQAKAPARR